MDITITIPAQRIADIMIGAVEGNHMTRSWCEGIYLVEPCRGDDYPEYDDGHGKSRIWYGDPNLYKGAFVVEIKEIVDESLPPTGDNLKVHRRTEADFRNALCLMAKNSPRHFGDLLQENDDNITQDVFLQYVALREVVYG